MLHGFYTFLESSFSMFPKLMFSDELDDEEGLDDEEEGDDEEDEIEGEEGDEGEVSKYDLNEINLNLNTDHVGLDVPWNRSRIFIRKVRYEQGDHDVDKWPSIIGL